jgi:hypothetical protein
VMNADRFDVALPSRHGVKIEEPVGA